MEAHRRAWGWKGLLFVAMAVACSSTSTVEPPLAVEAPPVSGGPPVWLESAMVKIRPQAQAGEQRELSLFAARNEFVSFQVAFHGGQAGFTVSGVSVHTQQSSGPITEGNITVYREALINITQPSSPDPKPGLWPDGLIPDRDELVGEKRVAFPLVVPPGEARALWVDLHVPSGTRPGSYLGRLDLQAGEGEPQQLQLQLHVVDALLPSTPSLQTAFFLGMPHVCLAFTGTPECGEDVLSRLVPLFYRLGLDHRITLTGGFPPLASQAHWGPLDWNSFEELWGPFLNGTTSLRLAGARMTSWQYMGSSSVESLGDFLQETRSRGWLPRAFHYVGDEPPLFSTFDEVRRRASLTRQVAPELRTLLTSEIGPLEREGLEELIDILAVLINRWTPSIPEGGSLRERYAKFLARPHRELWLYQSCSSHGCGSPAPENVPGQGWPSYMIDCASTKARAMEWVSFLEGAQGELYYQTAESLHTAWTDQLRYGGNGDGTLFYPGLASLIGGTTDIPLSSIRLKLIRLGLQDYEWLRAVSDAGDPEYARRVARWLIPATWRVPDDGALFDTARLCLMRRYLKLSGSDAPGLKPRFPEPPCPETLAPSEGG